MASEVLMNPPPSTFIAFQSIPDCGGGVHNCRTTHQDEHPGYQQRRVAIVTVKTDHHGLMVGWDLQPRNGHHLTPWLLRCSAAIKFKPFHR